MTKIETDKIKHVIFYDGVCVLCDRLSQFVIKNDKKDLFLFMSLQNSKAKVLLGKYGIDLDTTKLNTLYLLAHYNQENEQLFNKSDAALLILKDLGGLGHFLALSRYFPRLLRDIIYDFVASNRYRLFGRYSECIVPSESIREKFIDI